MVIAAVEEYKGVLASYSADMPYLQIVRCGSDLTQNCYL